MRQAEGQLAGEHASTLEVHSNGLAALGAIAAASGIVDRFVGPPSDKHALLLAALVAGAGLAAWQITDRWDVAAIAALTAGLWSIPHAVPRQQLWIAALPIAVLLVPSRWVDRVHDAGLALIAALPAMAAGVGLGLDPWASALAAAGAAGFVLVLPDVPTDETLRGVRTLSLFAPGLVLLGLLAVNAGTGWLERPDGWAALSTGIGLFGLLALVALAGLGLSTLLASSDPAQRSAWLTTGLGLAVLLAVLPSRDIGLLRAAGAHAVGPLAVLASVAGARVGAGTRWQALGFTLPLVASLAQIGLF